MHRPEKNSEHVPILRLSDDETQIPGFKIMACGSGTAPLPTHKHEYFEIVYFQSEGCTHHIQGKEAKVKAGTLFFILPYLVHNEGFRSGAKAYMIRFTSKFLDPLVARHALTINQAALRRTPELTPFFLQQRLLFELQGEQRTSAEEKLEIMFKEYNANRLGSREIIRCQLKLLLLQIVRLHEPVVARLIEQEQESGPKRESVLKLLDYISTHLAKNISLEDLSRAVHLSPNYVSHLLKRETGKSFTELVMEIRLERAKELLQFTQLRLTEIAEQVGFYDASYFSRRFKVYVGQSPREFRESSS